MERINWNEAWTERNHQRRIDRSAKYWEPIAGNFRKRWDGADLEPYAEQFFEYSGLYPGETVFDMGCGPGTLAIPLAVMGHEVYAADFCSKMLDCMMAGAEEAGVADMIHPLLLDWNEDWSAKELPKCDIAIASRCMAFENLTASLMKLESVAKRKVCLGVSDKPAKHFDRAVAKAIGYERPGYGSYVYVLGELIDRDLHPELRIIRYTTNGLRNESKEDLRKEIRESFIFGLTQEQEDKLESYLEENIIETTQNGKTVFRLPGSENATTAHISWYVQT